jgi:probable blue pigment (indigoidine) exporter
MKTNDATLGVALATVLAPISWGTTYVTVTELLPAGRPLLVATVRVVPAGLLLLAVGRLRGGWRPRGRQWRWTLTLAACNFGLFFPLLIVAVYRLPGGIAASVGGIQPLLVALVAWLVGRRRPRRREVAVGVAAAVGVALVVIRPGAGIDPVGVAAAVAANVSFSTGVVLTRHLPTPPNRVMAAGWQLLLSGVVLVPLTVAVEGVPPAPTAVNLAGFTYLSVAATGVAFLLWFDGIRRLPVAAPPLLGLAAPVTGAAMGWILLGQALSATQIAGFVMTLAAIGYGASLRATAEPAHAEAQPAGRDAVQADLRVRELAALGSRAIRPEGCLPTGTSRR